MNFILTGGVNQMILSILLNFNHPKITQWISFERGKVFPEKSYQEDLHPNFTFSSLFPKENLLAFLSFIW
jgi:hypothetical protein